METPLDTLPRPLPGTPAYKFRVSPKEGHDITSHADNTRVFFRGRGFIERVFRVESFVLNKNFCETLAGSFPSVMSR